MPDEHIFDLSVIVPVLNEAAELPALFATLAEQRGVAFELIICDGGSSDGSELHSGQPTQAFPAPLRYLRTPRGRGRQMNAGAAVARSGLLLFLHADCRFVGCDALVSAVRAFRSEQASAAAPLAARFALRFRRLEKRPSLAYAFYESKARLNQADCIRGDQGFMLTRSLFRQLGGFDESLPFLEDVRLAFAIEQQARWTLLPATLSTSARRFETEGLCERQVINAIIANAAHMGWDELFPALPGLYRCRAESGRLLLFPLLDGIRTLIAGHDPAWRRRFRLETGRYVAANIWQLFFWLDVRSAFRAGRELPVTPGRWSTYYTRFVEAAALSSPMAIVTALAVQIWFRLLLISSRRRMRDL